jgi:hypothetical protein
VVHDSVTEEFQYVCRHCKKTAEEHSDGTEEAAGSCLFDSTTWDPMSQSEWVEWRKGLWLDLGNTGSEYIRDKLKEDGFAARIKKDIVTYGTATIHVSTDSGQVTVQRMDPVQEKNARLTRFLKKLEEK